MRNENLEQDLGWAPTQYPGYTSYDTGEWRTVIEDGAPVAVVYTNYSTSAGVSWLKQTETVMAMRKMFLAGAETGTPAREAYGAVESKFSEFLAPAVTGDMLGVNETIQGMMLRYND